MFNSSRIMGAGGHVPRPSVWTEMSSTYSTYGVVAPNGIKAGDVLIFMQVCSGLNSGVPTSAVPTGFTLATTVTLSYVNVYGRQNISYKVANGTESGTTLQGMFVSGYSDYNVLLVFRGANEATSVSYNGGGGNAYYNVAGTYSKAIAAAAGPSIAIGVQGKNTYGTVAMSNADSTVTNSGIKYSYDLQETTANSNTYSGSYDCNTTYPTDLYFSYVRFHITA